MKNTIIRDKMTALKDGDSVRKLLLSTVLGEIDKKSKEPGRQSDVSDNEVVAIIKKIREGCLECKNQEEADILSAYLPTTYSDEQLEIIIGDYMTSEDIQHKKDMGKVMKWLKENHTGKYDGKSASEIINKKLV